MRAVVSGADVAAPYSTAPAAALQAEAAARAERSAAPSAQQPQSTPSVTALHAGCKARTNRRCDAGH